MSDEARQGPVARRVVYRRHYKNGEWITAKRTSYYYVTPDQEAEEAAFHAQIEEDIAYETEQSRLAFEGSDAAKFWPSSGVVEFQCPWCAAKSHDSCELARGFLDLNYLSLCPVCRNHIALSASPDGITVEAVDDLPPMPGAIGGHGSCCCCCHWPLRVFVAAG